MARWYARFDSGGLNGATWNSGYVPTDLALREYRRIGLAFGAGDIYRTGLIASRSLLSAEAYDDLTGIYRNGGFGVIAPGDLYSSNLTTFVSFSAVYTSSLTNPPAPGIITPADYATRPTASVLSTDSRLGAVRTAGVGVSYNAYTSASNAVKATLDAVQDGAGTAFTPYTRPGQNRSRTFHSIYHDPDLQYFAWDDFTPSPAPTNVSYNITNTLYNITIGATNYNNAVLFESTDYLQLTASWTGTYKADLAGTSSITASVRRADNDGELNGVKVEVYAYPPAGTLAGQYHINGVNGGAAALVGAGIDIDIVLTASFGDAIIPANTSSKTMERVDGIVHIVGVQAVSLKYASSPEGLCGTNSAGNAIYYLSNGATEPSVPDVYIFSAKEPATIAPGQSTPRYYVRNDGRTITTATPTYSHDGGGELTEFYPSSC